jgi:hypothetical protein
MSDFTLPGFKSDKVRYSSFYARSKTKMEGVFSGTVKTVSKNELDTIKKDLESKLKETLASEINTKKPEDFLSIMSANVFSFNDPVVTERGKNVEISVEGTLMGGFISKPDLEKAILKIIGVKDPAVVKNLSDLGMTVENPEKASNVWNLDKISLRVTGEAVIVWQPDEETLKNLVSEKPASYLDIITKGLPSIAKAEASIKPFWKRTFPKADKIEIVY